MLRPLALTRIPEYADSICSWVGNCRSGCSAAMWSSAAVIACGVIGIKGDFSHRNRAASCLLVPMINGTGYERPSRTSLTG